MQPERISVLGTGRMRQQEKYLYRVAICDYMAKRFLPELIGSEFRVQGYNLLTAHTRNRER
jgi:hypothetical protein